MNLKNILLVVAIILVVIAAFTFLMAHQAHPKQDTKIIITNGTNLTEGDNLTLKLTDLNGTPLSGQQLNVTVFDSSGGFNQKMLNTDDNGQVSFKVDNKTIGNCVVKVKYNGNEKFDGCNFTDNIIVNKKVIIPVKINSTNITGYNYTYSNYTKTDSNYYGNSDVITVEN